MPSVLAVIQAHLNSKRFPNKIYEQLAGAPILYHVLNRVNLVSYITTAVVSSPTELDLPENVISFVDSTSEDSDVLSRIFRTAQEYKPDYIVRITSDCPVIDPFLIDYVIMEAVTRKTDYCTNVFDLYNYTFPDGQDVEVLSFKVLQYLNNVIKSDYGREHVTIELRTNPIQQNVWNIVSIENEKNYKDIKCSVDFPEDIKKIEELKLV